MATSLKNLSEYSNQNIGSITNKRFGIIVAEWNQEVTSALYQGAVDMLKLHGATSENIITKIVPGSYELSIGAQWLASRNDIDAVICIGCVIQGDTKHFDFICQAVATGITEVSLKFNKVCVFGVLTTNTLQQALDRSGGIHGNKGSEAAITAIKMLSF